MVKMVVMVEGIVLVMMEVEVAAVILVE